MSKGKIALITVAFALITFAIPFIVLLIFVDADYISIYVTAFGSILALALGFIVALILSVKKDLLAVVEEIKVQNAAIAFKLSKTDLNASAAAPAQEEALPAAGQETAAPSAPPAVQEKYDDFQ